MTRFLFLLLSLTCIQTFALGGTRPELSQITAYDAVHSARFGDSIAIDGLLAIIGASGDPINGDESGAAYLVHLASPDAPIRLGKLSPNDGAPYDNFGWAVALDNRIGVVGSPRNDEQGFWTGSVYLFDVSNPKDPVALSKIVASDAHERDLFGSSVAIRGDIVLVGAYGADAKGSESGAVYVFDISDRNNPAEVAKITGSGVNADDQFGCSVAIGGDIAIIGAQRASPSAAYVFDIEDPTNPIELGILSPGVNSGWYGGSVAIDGDLAVVGASGDSEFVPGAGAAFLFDIQDPSDPVLRRKLLASDADVNDSFGYSVAVDGEYVVVGAIDGDNRFRDSGVAYVYEILDPGDPEELGELIGFNNHIGTNFGFSLAMEGTRALVGAPYNSDAGNQAGAVYSFDVSRCFVDTNYDGTVDVNDLAYTLLRLGDLEGDGDANQDGVVDVNDISYVLFRLGNPCP